MASITKPPGEKNWVIQFYFEGRKYYKSLRVSNKRDAMELKRLIELRLAQGTFDPDSMLQKQRSINRLSQLVKIWQNQIALRKELTPKTKLGYTTNADILLSIAGDIRLNEITPAYIQDYILIETNNRYEPATVNSKVSSWRTMFSFAVRQGIIKSNPFSRNVPEYQKRLPIWFRDEELKLYLSYWNDPERPKWAQTYFVTLLNTGNRKTEHFNLRWSENVFLDEKCIKFKGKGRFGGKERIVPLNDAAIAAFAGAQRKLGDDRVFWQVETITAVESIWRRFKNATKFPHKLHNVRSNYATRLIRAGISIYDVMGIMGWEDYKTAKIYLGFSKDHLLESRNVVNFNR